MLSNVYEKQLHFYILLTLILVISGHLDGQPTDSLEKRTGPTDNLNRLYPNDVLIFDNRPSVRRKYPSHIDSTHSSQRSALLWRKSSGLPKRLWFGGLKKRVPENEIWATPVMADRLNDFRKMRQIKGYGGMLKGKGIPEGLMERPLNHVPSDANDKQDEEWMEKPWYDYGDWSLMDAISKAYDKLVERAPALRVNGNQKRIDHSGGMRELAKYLTKQYELDQGSSETS